MDNEKFEPRIERPGDCYICNKPIDIIKEYYSQEFIEGSTKKVWVHNLCFFENDSKVDKKAA